LAACANDPARPAGLDVDAAPDLALTRDLSIGHATDAARGFSSIHGLDVDRAGNVYVIDARERHIRVYDPRGEPLRTIGTRGSGPGEFETLPSFGVLGDTVWAIEGDRRRRPCASIGNVRTRARGVPAARSRVRNR
jgi:hypothetical protein